MSYDFRHSAERGDDERDPCEWIRRAPRGRAPVLQMATWLKGYYVRDWQMHLRAWMRANWQGD